MKFFPLIAFLHFVSPSFVHPPRPSSESDHPSSGGSQHFGALVEISASIRRFIMGDGLRSISDIKNALQNELEVRANQIEELHQELSKQSQQILHQFTTEIQIKENLLARQILENRDHTADLAEQITTLWQDMMYQFAKNDGEGPRQWTTEAN